MCTLAFYYRAFAEYPLLVAANRDEHYDRPSAAPALLKTNLTIVAGKDLRVGGTWMGVNEQGLFVGILNRRANGDAVPAVATRSRGLLCLDLLNRTDAEAAQTFIQLHKQRYQPFTVVVADSERAWTAYNVNGKIALNALSAGLHVFSSHAEIDWRSEKADRASKQFATLLGGATAIFKNPEDLVSRLQTLLSDHTVPNNSDGLRDAVCVHGDTSGTVSASIALLSTAERQFEFFHCPGPPCQNSFGAALILPIR